MKAFVLGNSKVEARILTNVLKKQGATTKHILTPDAITEKDNPETLVFLDWDNLELSAEQKAQLLELSRNQGAARVFVVGSRAEENEMLQAVDGRQEQIVYKPVEEDVIRRRLADLRKAGFAKMKLDVRVINAFIQAVVNTFETMVGIKPAREKVYLLNPHDRGGASEALSDISGVMGLSGDYHGSVAISLPVNLAIKSTALMLGEAERQSLDASVRDCIGEIINIVAGQAKAILANTPYRFELALPTVVVGKGHKIHIHEDSPTLVIVFTVEGTKLVIQVNIRPAKGRAEE